MGARVAVQEGSGVAEDDHERDGDGERALLLLRGGVQEQYQTSESEAVEGFAHVADALPAEARRAVARLPAVRQEVRRQGGLADAREELRAAVVLHVRVGL